MTEVLPRTADEQRLVEQEVERHTKYNWPGKPENYVPFDQAGHSISRSVANLGVYSHLAGEKPESVTQEYWDERVENSLKLGLDLYHECGNCGRVGYDLPIAFDRIDGEIQRVRIDEPCAAAEGLTFSYELSFPSGKMVVGNDLRKWYSIPREEEDWMHSYNGALGQMEYALAMAKLGCAWGFVSNTSPTVYRQSPEKYIIATAPIGVPVPEDEDEDFDFYEERNEEGLGEPVANICTDLWAYCIVDYDDYISKGGVLKEDWFEVDVVDVEPGTYRFTHHAGERDFEWDSSDLVVFTDIEKVA